MVNKASVICIGVATCFLLAQLDCQLFSCLERAWHKCLLTHLKWRTALAMSPYGISGFLKHWNLSMIEQLGLSICREQSPLISSHQQNPHFTPTTNLRVVNRNDVKQNTSTCLLAQAAKRQDGPDGPFAINQAMIKMERHEI